MVIRVLIADDHSVVREGLRMFLGRDPELAVVGEASDGAEAVELSQRLRPDVVLMDLLMPVMDGICATSCKGDRIRKSHRPCRLSRTPSRPTSSIFWRSWACRAAPRQSFTRYGLVWYPPSKESS